MKIPTVVSRQQLGSPGLPEWWPLGEARSARSVDRGRLALPWAGGRGPDSPACISRDAVCPALGVVAHGGLAPGCK